MEQIKNKLTINSLDEAIWLLELLIITIWYVWFGFVIFYYTLLKNIKKNVNLYYKQMWPYSWERDTCHFTLQLFIALIFS
jgi:hypothetical protein